jgi:hypothetical protein
MALAGPIGQQIVRIVRKAGVAFDRIVADPVGFVGYLVGAVKLGFRQFGANIWEHLKTAVIGWLLGALESAGLKLPKVWDVRGVLDLALQVLGISYAKMRAKFVKVIGEERVAMLERVFAVLRLIVVEGPAAAWQQIAEAIGSVWDLVIGGIKDWAVTRIVTAAVTKLATMLNPAGAVIQAVIAIYDTIAFFVERIQQIAALVESVVDSVADIAAGKLAQAANHVERTMARTLPVILGFLARLVGLGDVSDQIKKVITVLQAKVDKGVDRAIAWVVEQARSLLGRNAEKPHDERIAAAAAAIKAEIAGRTMDEEAVKKAVPGWRKTHGFTSLTVQDTEEGWELSGGMSPVVSIVKTNLGPIQYMFDSSGDRATLADAVPLRRTTYVRPKADPELKGYERLNYSNWVRGHLIHGGSGGPPDRRNLVPLNQKANAAMRDVHERELWKVITKDKKWYTAKVGYHDATTAPGVADPHHFVRHIETSYGPATFKSGTWTRLPAEKWLSYPVAAPRAGSKADFR